MQGIFCTGACQRSPGDAGLAAGASRPAQGGRGERSCDRYRVRLLPVRVVTRRCMCNHVVAVEDLRLLGQSLMAKKARHAARAMGVAHIWAQINKSPIRFGVCPGALWRLTVRAMGCRHVHCTRRKPYQGYGVPRSPVEADAEAIRAAVLLDEIMQAAPEHSTARIVVVRLLLARAHMELACFAALAQPGSAKLTHASVLLKGT